MGKLITIKIKKKERKERRWGKEKKWDRGCEILFSTPKLISKGPNNDTENNWKKI